MLILLKKVLFTITLNSVLFLILIIGIQNSSNKSKVKLILGETINLPIGFVVGISFISGSISSSILTMNAGNKKISD